MNWLAVALTIIIFMKVFLAKKEEEEFKNKNLSEKLEDFAHSVIKKCIRLIPKILIFWLVLPAIAWGLKFFLKDMENILGLFIMKVCQSILLSWISSIILMILAIVILNGVVIPFHNYSVIVEDIYGKYKFGKVYYRICRGIEKFVTCFVIIAVCALFVPTIRGKVILNRDFKPGALEEVYLNGSIQAGNGAFRSRNIFGNEVWYLYSAKTQWYDKFKGSTPSMKWSFLGEKENYLCKCANIDGRLVGIIDKEHIYIRSLSGLSCITKKYNWQDPVMKNGKYDYKKIFDLIIKSKNESITVEQVATIVGLLEKNVLIGLGDREEASFYEQREDGGYFIYYTSDGKKEYGPYKVDESKPIMAGKNLALFVNTKGIFCNLDMTNGKKYDMKSELFEGKIEKLNYYVTNGTIRVCLFDGIKVHVFSFGENQEYKSVKLSEKRTVEGIYASEKMLLIDETDEYYGTYIFKEDENVISKLFKIFL